MADDTFEMAIANIGDKITSLERSLLSTIEEKKTAEAYVAELNDQIDEKRKALKEWRTVALKLKGEVS